MDESLILAGHFAATKSRMAAAKGPILVLHDTTEFSFQRKRPDRIGQTCLLPSYRLGIKPFTQCGLLMHSSLALTTAGKPLGLTAVKFWTRKKFKGTNALAGRGKDGSKHRVNPARIHIGVYNFVRVHQTLNMTPAMAAGVTDTLWNLETFYDVVNQHEKDMKRKAANRRLIQKLNEGV